MNIVILDDYQDAVRKLACATKLEAYPAKVYTNTVKGTGQLSVRLKDADVIVLIREREQGARRLRAMTGETRMTALVLGMLPVFVVGFFMSTNPDYMLKMWQDGGGQHMLLTAMAMQIIGSFALWRMVRSV